MYDLRKHVQNWCFIVSLVVVLSACGQPGKDRVASIHHTPTATSASEQLTCPAPNSARAAIMPSLSAGGHPDLVYLSQYNAPPLEAGSYPDFPLLSIRRGDLLRYDSVTAASSLLLQGKQIGSVNVSPDGQWLLLVSPVQGQEGIQLLRIDGQHLQTLYCAPDNTYIGMVLFSPDQHALVFTQASCCASHFSSTYSTYLLNVATGKLRLIVSSGQSGYPLRSDEESILEPVKWANNNSMYFSTDSVEELMNAIVSLPSDFDLYLLRDSSQDAFQQQNNLQLVAPATGENRCDDFDITPNNQQLACISTSASRSDTLKMASPVGSTFHTVYHDSTGILQARVISNASLLFIQAHIPSGWRVPDEEALWKINTDGSQPVKLMTSPGAGYSFGFADDRQPWSTLSRDGSLYAITADRAQSLLVGTLNGGSTRTIPMPKDATAIKPVGWTQL